MRSDRLELGTSARVYTQTHVAARVAAAITRVRRAVARRAGRPPRPLTRALASSILLPTLRAALAPWLGDGGALTAGLLAALVPLASWPSADPRRIAGELEPCAIAVALGFLLLPLILRPVGELGTALALGDGVASAPIDAGSLWLSGALLEPLWEERLFRGVLLRTLCARFGAGAALLAVAALTAACHTGTCSALVGAVAGLVLGLVMLASGSLALCAGLHAGLNLAALAGGVAPLRDPAALLALPPVWLPLALGALCVVSCSRRPPSGACPSRHSPTRGSRC